MATGIVFLSDPFFFEREGEYGRLEAAITAAPADADARNLSWAADTVGRSAQLRLEQAGLEWLETGVKEQVSQVRPTVPSFPQELRRPAALKCTRRASSVQTSSGG
jgi:hypothetical protein